MKPIDRPTELRDYYQDTTVADQYMRRRTSEPLNGVLHRRQVGFLNRALAARQPQRVLEIACGPGRLTTAMRHVHMGVAIDSSPAMLETAQRRMNGAAGQWSFLRTDAFVLPFQDQVFDAVYTLRFIRHFQLDERRRLYGEILRVLRPRGIFMVDALNHDVSQPYRIKRGVERYNIYDVLYRAGEIERELSAAGFTVTAVEGIIRHAPIQRFLNRLRRVKLGPVAAALIASLEYIPGHQPSGWMLLCEKADDTRT
jgi:ubiquinone/menaquinone biosynthesis C-methylase UbiE